MSTETVFLPTRKSKVRGSLLIFLLILMYILESSPITKIIDVSIFNYIVKPILWTGLSYVVWSYPKIRAKGQLKLKKVLNLWALNFAIIYIIIAVLAGVLDSLGKSPYNHSPIGILTNLVFVGSAIIGRELIRNYLVNSFTKEENYLVFILITSLMTITGISFNEYVDIKGYEDIVKLIAQYIAPEFAQNLFAVYLVYLGGSLTSIIYLGIIQGFHWLSPILPNLKWITTALVGVLCPIFFMMTLQTIYFSESKQLKRGSKNQESSLSWMITCSISIAIIWFAVGVFSIYPSVIATGSMDSAIKPGDVILVEKIVDMKGINKLKVDDVIQYKRDGVLISHRIIDILKDDKKGISFKTKGDNNSGPDKEQVKPEDVMGKIVYTVPKIGWPTLLIKSDKDIPLDEIVF